jgi:GST-like protein
MSPNNRMPAIVDHQGPGGKPFTLFEPSAILIYLADKTGKLVPAEPIARYPVLQWLMFQKASIGPMMGQANHFRMAVPEKIPYAIERYTNESHRLFVVMDRRLSEAQFLGGGYSIADIATFPWVRAVKREPEELAKRPHLKRWLDEIGERPAVKRGLALMADLPRQTLDDEARSILLTLGEVGRKHSERSCAVADSASDHRRPTRRELLFVVEEIAHD